AISCKAFGLLPDASRGGTFDSPLHVSSHTHAIPPCFMQTYGRLCHLVLAFRKSRYQQQGLSLYGPCPTSSSSTGDAVKRGGITKAGNGRAKQRSLELPPSPTRFPWEEGAPKAASEITVCDGRSRLTPESRRKGMTSRERTSFTCIR